MVSLLKGREIDIGDRFQADRPTSSGASFAPSPLTINTKKNLLVHCFLCPDQQKNSIVSSAYVIMPNGLW